MNSYKYGFGIWFLLFSLFGAACTNKSVCLEPQTVALRGGFYYSNSDSTISLKDSFVVNANIYFGQGNSYFNNLKNASKFSVTLSTISDSSLIIFQSDSSNFMAETFDTIRAYHENELNFISVACGYQFYHQINKITYTKHSIDTIYLNNTRVNNDVNKEHLKIVLRK
jgi:hypothetical protein